MWKSLSSQQQLAREVLVTAGLRLLVSVADEVDAAAALAGGADVIDAKNPSAGALGAVRPQQFRSIYRASGARPVSAALGDAIDEPAIERAARSFAEAGASFVKVGFAGLTSCRRIGVLIRAARRGITGEKARQVGLVAVAYADADPRSGIAALELVEVAAASGATGFLLDTMNKGGSGLTTILTAACLARIVSSAHRAGLQVAMAGRLTEHDFQSMRDIGTDIVGVRGAACSGGRNGRVTADKVRTLAAACRRSPIVEAAAQR